MDTLIFLLIFILSFFLCKKESTKEPQEIEINTIKGIYEVYPSYHKILIKFNEEECQILYKDIIQNCVHQFYGKELLIYTENLPKGIFYIEGEKKIFKGIWEQEARFLKKIDSNSE